MKAIVYESYGAPDVLQIRDVDKPSCGDDDVLIKVHASSVTTGDVNLRGFVFVPPGFKLLSRLMFGFNKPNKSILGVEVAGVIEAVGKNVTSFKAGDAVFGIDSNRLGAYAEYKSMSASAGLVHKPDNLTYEEATVAANGALTALTFLKTMANVQSRQKVLINGASGSVGSAAVEIAKALGAEVTAVCSTKNLDWVKALGADAVIDYTQEDFTQNGETYDIVMDTVGKTTFAGCKNSLKPNGLYLASGGGLKEMLQSAWTSIMGGKKVKAGMSSESQDDLLFIKGLIEKGKFKPYIDRCYPMDEIVEAHRYVDQGHKKGNVVISIIPENA